MKKEKFERADTWDYCECVFIQCKLLQLSQVGQQAKHLVQ